MVGNSSDSGTNAFFSIVESLKPCFEIDSAVMHHVDVVLRDSRIQHVADHVIGIHVLSTAVAVANYHDRFHSEFKNSYQQASYNAAKRMGYHSASVFDYLASPFLSPNAAGRSSVRRVSMQLTIASFLSGYLSVEY